jgi:cobalt-zinc-cadmium resistance protein CzcA
MVENIFRQIAHHSARVPADRPARLSDKLGWILIGAVEVDKAIFFSVIITIAAFLPLFTMQGVEGQIFGPMARTYAYALIGAVIATFTVTPVLASILLPAHVQEVETFVVRHIRRLYQAVLVRAVRNYRRAAVIAAVFVLCLSLGLRLGTGIPAEAGRGQSVDPAVMPPTITLEAEWKQLPRSAP